MRRLTLPLAGLLCALGAAACGSSLLSQIPTAPSSSPKTDTFAGQLTTNGGTSFSFTTVASGPVKATLTDVGGGVAIGFSLGTWDGTTCHLVMANDAAVAGAVLSGTASSAGTYCVRVYDPSPSTVTDAVSYSVNVEYPGPKT
ncbi:MAG: hypothetical protein DMF86_03340 [Acidobacteria bacterium]|nr:MAG: hypothetical protein DMF86_03340 [Acidobacteriota bacterium]